MGVKHAANATWTDTVRGRPFLELPRFSNLAWLVVALSWWLAMFGEAIPVEAQPSARKPIEISGTVVDGDDAPLSGIRVVAYPSQGPLSLGRSFVRGADVAAEDGAVTTRTRRDGSYRFELPHPGLWSLRFDGAGPAGDLAPARILMLSALVRDTQVRTVGMQLPEVQRLQVLDGTGRGLEGAKVEFTSSSYGTSSRERVDRFPMVRGAMVHRQTGPEGLVDAPTSGRSGQALVVARDHLPTRAEWNRDKPLDTVQLEPAPWRSVVVERPDGRPAVGAVAFVASIAVGETDGQGRVDVPMPPAGREMDLVVLGTDQESLRVGLEPEISQSPQRLRSARRLTVNVTSSEGNRGIDRAWVWEDWGDVARTDETGRAVLDVTAEFFSPHHWAPKRSARTVYGFADGFFSARSGEVAESSTDPVAIALDAAGELSGRVVDEQGRALRGVPVLAPPTDMRASMIRRQSVGGVMARTGQDGSFELFSLDPKVELEISARASGFARTSVTRSPLEVGGTDPVQLRMLQGILASGQVTDEGGAPIAGAVARLVPVPVGGQDVQALLRQRFRPSQPAPEAVSDLEGLFEFVDLDAGVYSLEVKAGGFAPTAVSGLEVQRGVDDETATGEAREAAPVFDIGTITMIPGQVLEGVVRTGEGRAVSGARVRLGSETNSLASLGRDEEPTEVVTEDDGRFRFDSLAADVPYSVSASASGFADGKLEGLRLPLEDAVDMRLEPASSIRGRVLGPEGEPLEGAVVFARGQSEGGDSTALQNSFASDRTDESGRFELEDLARARWSLTINATGYVTRADLEISVRPPEAPPDLTVRLEEGATLRGVITGPDGEPVAEARVERRKTGTAGGGMNFSMGGGRSAADGRYTMEGLAIGPASFSFNADGYLAAVRDAEVRPGENVLDIQLERGFSISGVVVDGDGRPVAGAEMARNQPRARRFNFGRNAGVYSQADGTFELNGLESGLWEVTASKDGYAVGRTEEPIQIDGASVSGVRVELSAGATVSGTITGLSFDELGRTAIYASQEGEGGMPLLTQPDYEGSYRLAGLTPGRWTLNAAVEDGKSKGESLEIDPGQQQATVDFEFGTGLELRGVVLRGEEPAAGASVRLVGLATGGGGQRTTDPNGRFVFDDIEPGAVELSVSVGRSLDVYRETVTLDIDREIVVRLGGGRLPLQVVDGMSGRPLAGVRISVEREETFGFRGWGAMATGDDGRLVLSDLQAGEQTIHVEAEGYGVESVTTTVVDGENAELVIGLTRASGVRVTLLDARGRALRSGSYSLLDEESNVQVMRRVEPDETGGFLLEDLAPGVRDVAFADDRGTVARRTVTVPAEGDDASSITVQIPAAGDLQVEIPELRGTQRPIELRVFDASGEVIVSPRMGARRRSAGEVTFLTALPVGTVRVEATTRDGELSWSGQAAVQEGTRVTLTLQ